MFFYKSWRKRREDVWSCHSHSTTCGLLEAFRSHVKGALRRALPLFRGDVTVSADLSNLAGFPVVLLSQYAGSVLAMVFAAYLLLHAFDQLSLDGCMLQVACSLMKTPVSFAFVAWNQTFAAAFSASGPPDQPIQSSQPRLMGPSALSATVLAHGSLPQNSLQCRNLNRAFGTWASYRTKSTWRDIAAHTDSL